MYDSSPSLEVEYYEYREKLVLILVYLPPWTQHILKYTLSVYTSSTGSMNYLPANNMLWVHSS